MEQQQTKYAVLDGDGFLMAIATPGVVARALKRGEIAPTDKPGIYRLIRTEDIMRKLTPLEKYRRAHAKK